MFSLRSLFALLAFATVQIAAASPAHWASEIAALTQDDASHPPPHDAVLFIGSSSIRLWSSLAVDFPGVPVINRGFGGSELADSVFYADRIAIPYHPRAIVLYAGDNDIAAGKSPERVAADFAAFREKIHAALPDARLFYLSIKLSPSRARFAPAMRRANELVAGDCAAHPHCTFVDLATPLLDGEGHPRPEFFKPDMLHLNASGYAAWTKVLAPLLQP